MTCAWTELLGILPPWLKVEADRRYRDSLQEIRLRLGKPAVWVTGGGATSARRTVTEEDLAFAVNTACRYSPWTASGASSGYITAPGGHRIGLCGEAVVQDGRLQGLRRVFSLNIRVARDFPGLAGRLAQQTGSILLLGKPGSGKTTLLRDLIRELSQRETVSVVDERGELFPFHGSDYCFDTGQAVDILTGCSKKQGLDILVRTMSPDTVAVDEITAREDCQALLSACFCGVRVIATAHAANREDLLKRDVYKPLVEAGVFDTVVTLQPDRTWRAERMRL